MTEEFRQQWLEAMQEYSKALEVEDDSIEVISDPSAIDETISMPGVKLDGSGKVDRYVQIRYSALATAIANAQTTLAKMNADADELRTVIVEIESQAESARKIIAQLDDVPEQAEALRTYVAQADTLIEQLTQAISKATTVTTEAERVNATLSGTTLTVTNRNGQQTSVDTKGEKGDKGDQGIQGQKGADLTWQTMTQEEKDALVDTVVGEAEKKLNVASIETCEAIIDELN